jgi:hypothetical protein
MTENVTKYRFCVPEQAVDWARIARENAGKAAVVVTVGKRAAVLLPGVILRDIGCSPYWLEPVQGRMMLKPDGYVFRCEPGVWFLQSDLQILFKNKRKARRLAQHYTALVAVGGQPVPKTMVQVEAYE